MPERARQPPTQICAEGSPSAAKDSWLQCSVGLLDNCEVGTRPIVTHDTSPGSLLGRVYAGVTVSTPTFVDRFRSRIGLLHLLGVFSGFLPPGLNQNALASQTKKVLPAGRSSYTRGSAMRALTHLHTTDYTIQLKPGGLSTKAVPEWLRCIRS